MHCRQTHRACCWPPESWLAKASTIRRWTPWCWRCPSRGRAYAGRLHREHARKIDVRIIDFVDTGHLALLRMWDKRQRGYRAMGYRVEAQREFDENRVVVL